MLKLRGKKVGLLNDHKEEVLRDLQEMEYDDVAEKWSEKIGVSVSKGSVWRLAAHYNKLKTKDKSIHGSASRRSSMVCGRNTAPYKGGYPGGFLQKIDDLLQIREGSKVLHLFSGSIQGRENEDTMDIQETNNPTFVADATKTFPMEDGTYDYLLVDPPYDMVENTRHKRVEITYSSPLWETEPIRPYAWVNEAVRVTKPGGFIAILHHLVYKTLPGCSRVHTASVTTGPNMRIRVVSIFQKDTDLVKNLKDNDEYRILEKKQHMLDDLLVSQARMDEMMEEVFGKDAAEEFRREHL